WPLIKHLPDKTNFRFVGPARVAAVISVLAVIASLFFTLYPPRPPCGGLNCGVDFKGGTVLELSTAPRPVDLGAVRGTLDRLGFGDVQVQAFGSPSEALIRFEVPAGQNPAQAVTRARGELVRVLGPTNFTRVEVVGPKVSGELFRSGVTALFIAIALMLLYIWFRFGLTFGVGAVVALFHDVILTFGLFAVTNLEFTLTSVAALLTIIGYSMNDTVVVLDRVRENLRKYKKMKLGDIIDLSVNETLSRTVVTGLTGLLALGVMAVFGRGVGELFTFSVAMIFGIIIGTYSSIFVAAPVLLVLGVRRGEVETPAQGVTRAQARAALERP
ncbi:MAG: protein translocase subunit SecF, partial [Proteobacteria bacterium]|nr:protein translocase subunit SecF [Pseudomonadota bacterium]